MAGAAPARTTASEPSPTCARRWGRSCCWPRSWGCCGAPSRRPAWAPSGWAFPGGRPPHSARPLPAPCTLARVSFVCLWSDTPSRVGALAPERPAHGQQLRDHKCAAPHTRMCTPPHGSITPSEHNGPSAPCAGIARRDGSSSRMSFCTGNSCLDMLCGSFLKSHIHQ